MIRSDIIWCRKCGAVRAVFDGKYSIPLDRAGDLQRMPVATAEDEVPTKPGTPQSKTDIKRITGNLKDLLPKEK